MTIQSSSGASGALLKIKATADRLSQMYNDDPRSKTYNAIIYGPPKVGKSAILDTCVAPVFVHSFDPGGTKVLSKGIKNGRILVDTRFEQDNADMPRAFLLWEKEMNALISEKFFDHVGTFALDSMTTWAQCIMYDVIRLAATAKKNRKVGGAPAKQDWMPQMNIIEKWMRVFASLPCNCVLLGHDDIPTNDEGEQIDDRCLMITGKLKKRVPAIFDEVYFMHIDSSVKGTRKLQTQPKNRINAGSRLGHGGKLEAQEDPDIKAILKKVGYPYEDKTLFKDMVVDIPVIKEVEVTSKPNALTNNSS